MSLDEEDADGRYRLEPADPWTAEKLYERRWALAVIEQALALLEQEQARSGQAARFQELKPFLLGDKSRGAYAEAAGKLGSSEGAVKIAVLRLRKRYRDLFRQVIAQTLDEFSSVEAELADLIAAVSS